MWSKKCLGSVIVAGSLLAAAVGSASAANILLADSRADWQTALDGGPSAVIPEQGTLNWEYGFYATDNTPSTFTQLGEFTNEVTLSWNPTAAQNGGTNIGSPLWTKDDTHPGFQGGLNGRWSVRRWTNEAAGQLRIFGNIADNDSAGGDGVTLRFFVNGIELSAQAVTVEKTTTPGSGIATFDFTLPLSVPAGQFIDFAIDDRANSNNDSTLFNVSVELVPEPSSAALLAAGCLLTLRPRVRISRTQR